MKKFLTTWGLLAVAATCAAALCGVYWGIVPFTPHAKATELGQLGDFFGGLLNPVVSILTLFVAISVWRLQKDELELTRHELAQTKAVMEDQAKTSEQQRAEARFFDLLNVYQSTLGSISTAVSMGGVNGAAVVLSGRSALARLHHSSIAYFFNTVGAHSPDANFSIASGIWIKDSEQIDHYFRTVFMVLREAEDTLGKDHHFRYVKMFRAQLSREELALLAFNMLLGPEGKQMRHVAARYGILKHLPQNLLRREVESKLNPQVFGRGFVQRQLSIKNPQGAPA